MGHQIQPLPPPQTDPETPHNVDDIPPGNKLSDWLTNNPNGTITVPAGNTRDAGRVRFTCPSSGDDCLLTVTLVEGTINVTSAGGMASATLVPPPSITTGSGGTPTTQQSRQTIPRRNGLFDMSGVLHGLNFALFPVFEGGRIVKKKLVVKPEDNNIIPVPDFSKFRIQDGKTKDFGRVRFSCRGAGCEVFVANTVERGFEVRYEGNVTATLLFPPNEMHDSMWRLRQEYCFNDIPNNVCDNNAPPRTLVSKEILLGIPGTTPLIVTEDMNTKIAPNYGWQGNRYAINVGDNPNSNKSARAELVVYTNADGPEDTKYLSYGRSMLLFGAASQSWYLDGAFVKSIGSQYGLGTETEKVTYSGGATGWYAFIGEDADAGHFTARAKLEADLGTALEISGTIDRFIDEEGKSRNWKVDLNSSNFANRNSPSIGTNSVIKTVWSIDGASSAPDRRWRGRVADEGNSIHGSFQSTFKKDGKDGRLNGAFGAERR